PQAPPGLQQELAQARERIRYLSRLVASDHFSTLTPWAREIYLDLVEGDVDAALALGILKVLPAHHNGQPFAVEKLRRHLRGLLRLGGTIDAERPGRRIVVLVGGPGVGKTTTCAKLAAQLRDAGHGVGLISLDTIRMAGSLHLSAYADVLGLPSVVVYGPQEIPDALDGILAPVSTVLVDTPGVRWSDPEGLDRLREFVEVLPEAQVHILVSASMRVRDQVRYVSAFGRLKAQSIIFTKVDETDAYGSLLTTPLKARLPLAYISDGQRVPEDLAPARADEITELILEGLDFLSAGDGSAGGEERTQGYEPASA
ncbi:MAG: hypothetical protein GF355_11170, partial [Candidatus Eisenbacteria bacterium]|nr:hypothetical protein [Candidatus Eisenbacteria bacterium]